MRLVSPTAHRVEDHTAEKVNDRIACKTGDRLAYYRKHPELADARLRDLDREWDVERWLMVNSATLTLVGLGLAMTRGKRWLLLPVTVQAFFMQHALQGWCPPLPALRRMGVRTTGEIEEERRALLEIRSRSGAPHPGHAARRDPGGAPFPPAPSAQDRPAETRMQP